MKKTILALVTASLVVSTSAANHESTIRAAANRMFVAVAAEDTSAIADATYPGLIEKMGGREMMMTDLARGIAELNKAGLKVIGNRVLEISPVVSAGPELHATVQFERTIKMPTGKQIRKTFLIAVSRDDGVSWTFVDGPQLTPTHIARLFPEFNPQLMIPSGSEAVFIRDED